MKTIYTISDIQKVEYIEEKIKNHINATKENFRNKTEEILNAVDVDDILNCIFYLYLNKPQKLDNFLKITSELEHQTKYEILSFMIENGISNSSKYVEDCNIDIKKIKKIDFLIGLGTLSNTYNNSSNKRIKKFFNLYYGKDEELAIEFAKKGFPEEYFYFKEEILELRKLNEKESLELLRNFEKRIKNFSIDEKVLFLSYSWDIISNGIFEDPLENEKIIKDILKFNKDEKEEFHKLKNDLFYKKYEYEIEYKNQEIDSMNFEKINEISFSSEIDSNINNEKLENSLKEINLLNNGGNQFKINFISVSGKIEDFILKPNKDNTDSIYNTYYDFDTFVSDIRKTNKDCLEKLENNDIDYTIIISKSKGTEETDPEEDDKIIDFYASNERNYGLAA